MSKQPATRPFEQAIEQLLTTNELILYGRIDEVSAVEQQAVLELLEERYKQEAIGFPGPSPAWHPAAANWATLVVFHAAQLLLYRNHNAETLADYFPVFQHPISAEAILSADITLRYLPAILHHLEAIDLDDELIQILKCLLTEWHYTGLLSDLNHTSVDLEIIVGDDCLARLYVDRIIATKNKEMAARSELQGLVKEAMGNHTEVFWNDLKLKI